MSSARPFAMSDAAAASSSSAAMVLLRVRTGWQHDCRRRRIWAKMVVYDLRRVPASIVALKVRLARL